MSRVHVVTTATPQKERSLNTKFEALHRNVKLIPTASGGLTVSVFE
jgi:hypothetical protein